MKPISELPPECRLIEGFPHYCVSRSGIVYSCRTRRGRFTQWKPMTQNMNREDNRGRFTVGLRNTTRANAYRWQVHILVLNAFVGPCPPGMEACHNDGNPKNNNASNLRWDTHKNNLKDRIKHGTMNIGEKHGLSKLTWAKVAEIRAAYNAGTLRTDLARKFKVSYPTIRMVCLGRTWKLSLFLLLALPTLGQELRFSAVCENTNCARPIIEAPALTIKTNAVQPVATGNGLTNFYLTVSLLCTNCHETNLFDSDVILHRPRATAIFRPAMPHRQAPAIPSLPATNEAGRVVTVKIPDGFELRVVPSMNTNK